MCVPTCYVESKWINSGHETKDIGNIGLRNCKQDSSLQNLINLEVASKRVNTIGMGIWNIILHMN